MTLPYKVSMEVVMLKKIRKLSLRAHFMVRSVITVIGLILILIFQSSNRNGLSTGALIGLVLIIIGIVWHVCFVRCPHCGSLFSLKRVLPKYCPWCGKYIDKFY